MVKSIPDQQHPPPCILLAAGRSSRLAPVFKPLLEIDGELLIHRQIRTIREAGIEPVVVTGHRAGELEAAISETGVVTARNERYDLGMFSSLQTGLRRVHMEDGVLICPVDHALVRAGTFRKIADALKADPRIIHIAVCGGRRGHPVGIPGWLAGRIVAMPPDTPGLRSLWQELADRIRPHELDDPGITFDLDTHFDLQQLKE